MELEAKISKFFFLSKKMFTLHQLERIFDITDSEKEKFSNALDTLVTKEIIMQKNERYFSDFEKDDLTKRIEEFFQTHNKVYSPSTLEKIFNITSSNRVKFYNCLNELEIKGKIIYLDNAFMHVPSEFYLKSGCLMKSNQDKYYIKVNDQIITIEDTLNAKEYDIVFVEEDLSRKKHPKHGYGKIVRVVRPINSSKNEEYITKGIVSRDIKNNSYYFEQDFTKIAISKKNLNGAYPGDLVSLLVTFDNNNKPISKVVDIIRRNNNKHVFVFKNDTFIPIGCEEFKTSIDGIENYKENDQIIASVSTKKINGTYKLEVIEKISENNNTPRDRIKLFAIDRGLSFDFDEKVLEEANNISREISKEEIDKRLDLRSLETFTIDSTFAKDLDDAVSLEKTKNGYRLYVHIADVSYYIRPGMALFDESIKRGTSVYFGDMVIPELPPAISNGVCSLNPNEDKLTKTLIMEFDNNGKMLDFSLHNSIINSNLKMSYDKVNDLLEGSNIDGEYLPFYKTLCNMHYLANMLEEERVKRGSTSFTSLEYIYELDENGKPISVRERNDGPAQKIIENFMIITNQTLADYAYFLELPYIYRNHECPEFSKINILNSKIKQINHKFSQIKNIENPRLLQKYYEKICRNKTNSEIKYLSNIFLQVMPRAYYEDVNKGHYGLALPRYATFTSPIRRGPDLLNHLFLGEVLEKGIDTPLLNSMKDKLKDIASNLSLRQQEADNFEIEVDYLLLKEFAHSFEGKNLLATIDFLMSDKMYLKTFNNLSGVVELGKNYIFEKNELIDTTTGNHYHVGDEIEVKIASFDSKKHSIIFNLVPKEKAIQKKKTCLK